MPRSKFACGAARRVKRQKVLKVRLCHVAPVSALRKASKGIRRAQGNSCAAVAGVQTKIRRRLGELPGPATS